MNAFSIQCNVLCFLLCLECKVFPTGSCAWMFGPPMVLLFGLLSESWWYRAERADARIINQPHFHPKIHFLICHDVRKLCHQLPLPQTYLSTMTNYPSELGASINTAFSKLFLWGFGYRKSNVMDTFPNLKQVSEHRGIISNIGNE